MATVAHGVLVRDADRFLVGEHFDYSTHGDCQAERCRSLYRAAIVAHFQAALVERASSDTVIKDTERNASRRFLLSPLSPWREDREFICALAGYDPDVIRSRAEAMLRPLVERERATDAHHIETAAEREERLALIQHVVLGGRTTGQVGGLRRPKTAADWFRIAIASGDDDALAKAAERESTELAA